MKKTLEFGWRVLKALKRSMQIAKENLTDAAFAYVIFHYDHLKEALETKNEEKLLELVGESYALISALRDVNELLDLNPPAT